MSPIIWRFPKIGYPQIIHVHGIFMDFSLINHPFGGSPHERAFASRGAIPFWQPSELTMWAVQEQVYMGLRRYATAPNATAEYLAGWWFGTFGLFSH